MTKYFKNIILTLTHSHSSYVGMHTRACAHENEPNYSTIKVFFVSIDEITMWIAKGGLLFMCTWLKVGNACLFC